MDASLYFATKRTFYHEVPSLQTTVLRVITVNFQRYFNEYRSRDSAIPKYFFEFLQKKYSEELLKALVELGNLSDGFLNFVFNVHLHDINLQAVPGNCKMWKIKQKIIQIGESVHSISLMGLFNFHHLYPALRHVPNIRKLEIEYSNCDDSDIETIANNCPLLKELNVYASKVSDKGMKHLCFPKRHKLELESLTVSRTFVKDYGVLMILKYMPSIKVISHENLSCILSNGISKNELPRDRSLNLRFIEVHNPKTELQAISELCPRIRRLFMKGMDEAEQLSHCCAFYELEEVCLSYISRKRSSLCVNHFLQTCGYHITNLSLENFVLSVDVLLNSCPHLQLLELCDPIFEKPPHRTSPGAQFKELTYFKIYGSSLLSKEDIAAPAFILNSSPNLESLSLQYCFIGPHMEDVILSCPATLLQLDFTESLVSVNFLQEVLLKHTRLQCLIIENSGLHSSGFHNLFRLTDTLNHPVNILWC